MKKLIVYLTILCGMAFGQEGPSVIAMSVPPPSGVPSMFVNNIGVTQQSFYCYWVVAVYSTGMSAPQSPTCTSSSNSVLNSSNYNAVAWNIATGAIGYWVVRNTTTTFPASGTTAVNSSVLSASTQSLNDQSNSLNAFTFNGIGYSNAHFRLTNNIFTQPAIYLDTPLNTIQFANLPTAASAKGLAYIISDASGTNICTSGGGTVTPAFCYSNGSNWLSMALAGAGSGTVVNFIAGSLSPLFTTNVANPTTSPNLTFTLSNFSADSIFGNFTGGSAPPSTQAIPNCPNDGSHALVYVSHTLTCGVVSGGGGGGITQLTGDATAGPGSGSQALTFANVNSGPGVCGDGTHVCQITTNAKGLVTLQAAVAIAGGGGGIGFNGSPVANTVTTVFDSTHIQTICATCTLDGSGNYSTPGAVSTGVGGGVAGEYSLGQGTAPSFLANGFNLFAPTSIPSAYGWRVPGAAATGIVRGDNSSGTVAISQSEISGDCTTSGSNAIVCTKSNGVNITTTIASGTASLGTGAISSGACATAVTVSATGVVTTDTIQFNFNADPTGLTGYSPSTSGTLYIYAYPTANNVNYKVCNNTSGSITPSAATLNFKVVR